MDMVERVARAICANDCECRKSEECIAWREFVGDAAAAIEATDINGLIRRLHDGLSAKEGINLTSLVFGDSENYERDLATITAALEGE